MPCHHCQEFSRSHMIRQAAAQAGRGLPAIERGMPTPAGTGLSRRSLLLRSGAGILSVYGASKLRIADFEAGIAKAATGNDRVLVAVFLDGGIDGLSVLAPTTDSKYRQLRPTLAQPPGSGTPFLEDTRLNWHPVAAGLGDVHRVGKLSTATAIGYPKADQSHFTSRHYWEVGALDTSLGTGWMGRLLDVIGTPDNPLQGLALGGILSPTLAPQFAPVAAVQGASYPLVTKNVGGKPAELMFESIARLGQTTGKDPARKYAGNVATQSMRLRAELEPFSGTPITPAVPYPTADGDFGAFPKNLAALAAMLAGGLPIRCAAISSPGRFDTHANQKPVFEGDTKLTVDSLQAFQADLEARGLADRVITLIWSEFGRRPKQNENGTDHGGGGVGFVMGTKVRGKMIGEYPGLGQFDEDENLLVTADFRGLYCAIIEQWFGVDAGAVIPNASNFPRPALIA